ncbi:hypothetical protein GCM10023144_13240 [Pigmentiphaga soli]|uniref:DUF883 domain-containing protein n=2 Tax=Pigmentiphaga soli TaxID=1007095 RepID=A0ABP8GPS2_9BURK
MSGVQRSTQQIADSVRGLVEGAEELLKSTSSYAGEDLDGARGRLSRQLTRAKSLFDDLESTAADTYRQTSAQAEAYVRDNPWRAVGIAAAVGVLVSLVALRR